MRKLNLTNRRFGRLVAIKEHGKKSDGSISWLCKCDCGNYTTIAAYRLKNYKNYHVTSCGCFRSEKTSERRRLKLLSGQRFNRLTVVSFAGITGKGNDQHSLWKCVCDCGNEVVVRGYLLRSGNTKSCGCYQRECFDAVRNDSKKENNPNWKGGITIFYQQIHQFLRYELDWQNRTFERDNYTCQKCNGYGGTLNAHHLMPVKQILKHYNIDTMEKVKQCGILSDIDNSLSLCKGCHDWVHSRLNIHKEYLYGF